MMQKEPGKLLYFLQFTNDDGEMATERKKIHSVDDLPVTNGDECEMTQKGSENVVRAKTMADGRQTRDNKRRRWEAKQARLGESKSREDERETWMSENAHYCTHVSTDDVARAKTAGSTVSVSPNGEESSHSFVISLLRPYVDLKDGPKQIESSDEVLFIAEGAETVRLLIQQSERENAVKVKSIFVKPATLFDDPVKLLTDIARASELHSKKRAKGSSTDATVERGVEQRSPPFHLLVANEQVMSEVAGFHIARGALSCGVVPRRDEVWLNKFLSNKINSRLLALDGISDSANMGAMIRCAAAFGIDAMILSHNCCDAWYRRSVRVSMGHIFHVPVVRVDDMASTLRRLAATSYAAVIDQDADLVLEEIARGGVSHSWCCVMGNEGNGISPPVVQACTHRLRIGMASGVDSLSVAVAAGILLHGLKEREARDDR